MKVEIEPHMRYELGKTLYSIESLRDWFLIRRMFVDPMTNLVIKNKDLDDLMVKMREMAYFPEVNIGHIPVYRVYCIFEKYSVFNTIVKRHKDKLEEISKKIDNKKEKMLRSRKRKNGENAAGNYERQIEKLGGQKGRINDKIEVLEKRFWENVDLLVNSRKKREEIV